MCSNVWISASASSAGRIGEAGNHTLAMLFQVVTDRKRALEALNDSVLRLRHRTHHDPLTGVPHRTLFEERLELALARAMRYERKVAVLFLDLDGFKAINDTHDHSCGDAVLKEVSQRLKDALRTSDTVSRLHGDEFVVLHPEVGELDDVKAVATTILAEMNRPVVIGNATASVSASIGVSLFPQNARHVAGLMHAADAAMYRAKASGKNAVRFLGFAGKVASRGRGSTPKFPAGPVRSARSRSRNRR